MPISGEVIEINTSLEDSPESINSAPYENWIIKVKISDSSELEDLMTSESYADLVA